MNKDRNCPGLAARTKFARKSRVYDTLLIGKNLMYDGYPRIPVRWCLCLSRKRQGQITVENSFTGT